MRTAAVLYSIYSSSPTLGGQYHSQLNNKVPTGQVTLCRPTLILNTYFSAAETKVKCTPGGFRHFLQCDNCLCVRIDEERLETSGIFH